MTLNTNIHELLRDIAAALRRDREHNDLSVDHIENHLRNVDAFLIDTTADENDKPSANETLMLLLKRLDDKQVADDDPDVPSQTFSDTSADRG